MYLIALCDDDAKELDQIENLLTEYQKKAEFPWEYKAERFTSAEELLSEIRENGYTPDFMLLDIYMQGKTGIEAAWEPEERKL